MLDPQCLKDHTDFATTGDRWGQDEEDGYFAMSAENRGEAGNFQFPRGPRGCQFQEGRGTSDQVTR